MKNGFICEIAPWAFSNFRINTIDYRLDIGSISVHIHTLWLLALRRSIGDVPACLVSSITWPQLRKRRSMAWPGNAV